MRVKDLIASFDNLKTPIMDKYGYESENPIPQELWGEVMKEIDEVIVRLNPHWSNPHLCSCGRLTKCYLMYQFYGCKRCIEKTA